MKRGVAACAAGMLMAACSGPAQPSPPTVTSSTPAGISSPTALASPTPTPCSPQTVLATWPVQRLAEQTIVVPVDETDVSAVTAEVSDGAGGVILFGSSAPSNLGSALAGLSAAA